MQKFFIGLGFQKCATTWLSIRLAAHPSIWCPPIRELHYLDNYDKALNKLPLQTLYIMNWSNKLLKTKDKDKIISIIDKMDYWKKYVQTNPDSIKSYMNLFQPSDSDLAYGEITPSYSGLSEDTLKEICDMKEKPKVFLIMREPIARIWSQIRHVERIRPNDVSSLEKQLAFLESEHVRMRSDYAGTIKRVQKVFPSDRIGYFFFEDMLEDQEKYLKNVCDFLGVKYNSCMVQVKRNRSRAASKKMSIEVEKRAIELYGNIADDVRELLGHVPDSWSRGE